jgi:hypothetical protein
MTLTKVVKMDEKITEELISNPLKTEGVNIDF